MPQHIVVIVAVLIRDGAVGVAVVQIARVDEKQGLLRDNGREGALVDRAEISAGGKGDAK